MTTMTAQKGRRKAAQSRPAAPSKIPFAHKHPEPIERIVLTEDERVALAREAVASIADRYVTRDGVPLKGRRS